LQPGDSVSIMPVTAIIPVNPNEPEPEVLAQAATILRQGGLVAFPTETVYGLGANALDATAVQRIFEAKGRPATNPLIVHVAGTAQAKEVVSDWPPIATRLAEQFWPGPLTLVLPKRPSVPDIVTAGGPTVAVRVPAHPVAQGVIAATGLPLAAPSANRSTRLSPTRAEHVRKDLAGRIDLILDGGPTPGGLESTVIDLACSPPRILRPGLVTPEQIEKIIGPIQWQPHPSMAPGPARSPGMMARHYAPKTPLELAEDDGWNLVVSCAVKGQRVGWLTFRLPAAQLPEQVRPLEMPSNPLLYGKLLYDVLHSLDDSGLDRIVVAMPPDSPDWLAIRDRLRRAAHS
jgi:L-threonylcarbamoyladenylate synthase